MISRPRDLVRRLLPITWDVLRRFEAHYGWAIAAHVAMSALLAIFPFLIFVTALAAFLGAGQASASIVHLIFDTWPPGVAGPLAGEVDKVLTTPRGGVLTIGVLLTLWVTSSAVESLRIALGRAYDSPTSKPFWLARLQSMWFVVLGAFGLVAVALLIVLWPVMWKLALSIVPGQVASQLAAFELLSDLLRYGLTVVVLGVALTAAHLWLPGGRRSIRSVMPGVAFTIVVWLLGATLFSVYLSHFANYASTYAGLAGVMTAIVFLNASAALFILGGEVNAALAARKLAKAKALAEDSLAHMRAAPEPA
ncbi:YihY/virulence factor BrkB family protein [Chelatococcus sambhunathii]|uniref:YihY/virulence factor BrkB family protein n=1 Tax=Chelatococcus sambhunathii TaxID=363953 RepID=UPI002852BFE9|nr:YihY/virulence factor BrkB family protein [Chelatococcus sambhunathii]